MKIAICIVTYNHEKYIAQAIESVLKQQINVPFVIFIGEDYSSDDTRKICLKFQERYPEKIKLILHNINQGLVKNTISIIECIKKENFDYIAMLDGDDYWIDEHKLQKELDFIVENPNYGFVHTNIALLSHDKYLNFESKKDIPTGIVSDKIANFPIANCSAFFKTTLLKHVILKDFILNNFMSCDYVMYAIFAQHTKFGFIEDFTAVWRRGHTSVSNTNNMNNDIAYIENDLEMWRYLSSLFPENFTFSEHDAQLYKNYRTFNIAFRYKNFEIANNLIKKQNLPSKGKLTFRIKKIAASSRYFFKIWCLTKDITYVFRYHSPL
jgi:glycosyltransferase involved in cell wall biosynthesis